ncbi:MAG: ImmA/IrrE family metallo-endopeptidase [Bacteroidales bacterium]|nr:ImmA/IrrE family metallo-endopeptidase [Bacteroidales bacterium]
MVTPDFERCTALATELLYKQNIKDRILNIRNLDYGDKTIVFESVQNYARLVNRPISDFLSEDNQILNDGCTLVPEKGIYIILYNEQVGYWEHLNWTLAHEIGHIYLGHTEDSPIAEVEAHFFAAQLFMPEYSIYMMRKEHGRVTMDDLIEIFGVSPEAAQKRIETMNKKGAFRASKIDREIWDIQKKRVDIYYECEKNKYQYRNTLDFELYMESEYEHMLFA